MKIGIVGGGISGLATAQALLKHEPTAEIKVYEASAHPGGKVLSEKTPEGYLCEWGVNGFLDKVPRTLELCEEVGLRPLGADVAAKKRFVFSDDVLHKLPEKPLEFLASRLVTARGKLRMAGEAFISASKKEDESLEDFATRRLGREAFEKLIDPMASGVFAGNPEKMSLVSCFPRIREIEQQHGSLIRGLVRLQKEARKRGDSNKPGPGPGGLLTSFEGGMSVLTDTLAVSLGSRLRLNCPATGLDFSGGQFTLQLAGGETDSFDQVVLACPAWSQAEILSGLSRLAADELRDISYPSLAVVCLGYAKDQLERVPEGFGFLVPSREQRDILGTVIDSNVFPNRAPEGHMLLRTMVGGARAPALAEQDDGTLLDRVRSNLADILGIHAEPAFASIYRHQRAIPQYAVGHATRLDRVDQEVSRFPGLEVTGNAYRGVSLNDCVVNAEKTALKLLANAAPTG